MIEDGDRSDREYWNKRVRDNRNDLDSLIWATNDAKRKKQGEILRTILKQFSHMTVVDVACGYGQYCTSFKPENYYGFDFSDEMIKLAREKYPLYQFGVQDANTFEFQKTDIVLCVNSLGNMKMSIPQFIEKYEKKADLIIIADSTSIIIHPVYE